MIASRTGFWALALGLLVAFHPGPSRAASDSGDDGAQAGRRLISSGTKWEDMAAYSRAVVDGDWIFVSGTVGYDPATKSIPADFDAQIDQIFTNIATVLGQAGAGLGDIVRVRCFLADREYVGAMSRGLRRHLNEVRPTNTTVIVELATDDAKIEIEVTALRRKNP